MSLCCWVPNPAIYTLSCCLTLIIPKIKRSPKLPKHWAMPPLLQAKRHICRALLADTSVAHSPAAVAWHRDPAAAVVWLRDAPGLAGWVGIPMWTVGTFLIWLEKLIHIKHGNYVLTVGTSKMGLTWIELNWANIQLKAFWWWIWLIPSYPGTSTWQWLKGSGGYFPQPGKIHAGKTNMEPQRGDWKQIPVEIGVFWVPCEISDFSLSANKRLSTKLF